MSQPASPSTSRRSVAELLLRSVTLVGVVVGGVVAIGATDAWWVLALVVVALLIAAGAVVLSVAGMLAVQDDDQLPLPR
jgi:hypothetical protein